MAIALIVVALAILAACMGALLTNRITLSACNGWLAVANAVLVVVNVLDDNRALASVNAACAALSAWWWWHSGGGDGTKRRLKRWARKFEGVRRTAPAGGAP